MLAAAKEKSHLHSKHEAAKRAPLLGSSEIRKANLAHNGCSVVVVCILSHLAFVCRASWKKKRTSLLPLIALNVHKDHNDLDLVSYISPHAQWKVNYFSFSAKVEK